MHSLYSTADIYIYIYIYIYINISVGLPDTYKEIFVTEEYNAYYTETIH